MSRRQYTIRSVPDHVDRALRRRARQEHKSLNKVILEALEQAVATEAPKLHHDLDFLIGTWREDPAFDEAMKDFEQIDEEMWR
jgi:plasmid stability protein